MLSDLTVVKVGGHEVDDATWLTTLARSVRELSPAPLVVVHGGGKEVTALQRRLGIEPEWRDGLRVTDDATLDVVAMVLSGLVNKRIVAALVGAGVRAAGVSGEDDGLIGAEPARGGALGRTGVVTAVRPELLRNLLSAGVTPIVSPLSRGPDGGALNVNADDAAVALAAALGASRLLFVSNVPGVAMSDGVAAELGPEAIAGAVADGLVTGGMQTKLRAAARASEAGVPEVRIGGVGLLGGGEGTRVRAEVPAGVRSGERAA